MSQLKPRQTWAIVALLCLLMLGPLLYGLWRLAEYKYASDEYMLGKRTLAPQLQEKSELDNAKREAERLREAGDEAGARKVERRAEKQVKASRAEFVRRERSNALGWGILLVGIQLALWCHFGWFLLRRRKRLAAPTGPEGA
jgi:hypothetical protein